MKTVPRIGGGEIGIILGWRQGGGGGKLWQGLTEKGCGGGRVEAGLEEGNERREWRCCDPAAAAAAGRRHNDI